MTYDAYKVTKAFDRMFLTCHLPLTTNDPDGAEKAAAMYLEACEGYSTGAIVDACEDFTFGRVEGVRRNFAPSIPQFAAHLRAVQSNLSGLNASRNAALKQLEERDRDAEIESARTPESMARVKAMVEAFSEKTAPKKTPEEIAAAKEMMRKTDEYFADDFVDTGTGVPVSRSLAKQFGYETFDSAEDDAHDMGGMK